MGLTMGSCGRVDAIAGDSFVAVSVGARGGEEVGAADVGLGYAECTMSSNCA